MWIIANKAGYRTATLLSKKGGIQDMYIKKYIVNERCDKVLSTTTDSDENLKFAA